LHPAREPLAVLQNIRRTMGEYNFAGQYQQSPAPPGGGLVKAEWFKRYDEKERPERFDRIVQSWDTANKATERGSLQKWIAPVRPRHLRQGGLRQAL
jgi:hypothetical protein